MKRAKKDKNKKQVITGSTVERSGGRVLRANAVHTIEGESDPWVEPCCSICSPSEL